MRAMPRQFLILCCRLLLVQLAAALTGDNVCKRTEMNSETIEYVAAEPVTYRVYTWCLKMPPRCSKYTTIMKERIKTKLQVNNHTVDFCCDGYVQLETYCVPECNKTECPHMNCDSEKKCVCEAGYYGQRCHRTCRTGFWGENCVQKCACNGEPCNLKNGDCLPTTTTPISTTFYSGNITSQHNVPSNKPKDQKVALSTKSLEDNNKITIQLTTASMTPQQNKKPEKTDLSLEDQESDLDPTMIPFGLLEDMDTTLLPEDEVIIVYPSPQTKSYSPSTRLPELQKITSLTSTSVKKQTQKALPIDHFTKPPLSLEKIKKSTTADYYSKMHELKFNKNKLLDISVAPTEQLKINVEYNNNLSDIRYRNKTSFENNKKYYASTAQPIIKSIKYNAEDLIPKKSNGLPPPVPDGSDNSLQIKNNESKNSTMSEENYENGSNNIIKTNDIQRDMEELNNNNVSRPNTDRTVNSSLVKAKWNSALGVIDLSAPSTIISIIVTIILFFMIIVMMITQCKKNKSESSSFYNNNNSKMCHHDSTIPYSGQYASSGGQPIFFCPAFTNTYAFELAQELREAHYDHPRSARCLTNEPVYAELQY